MSVLIRGMEMPTSCAECRFNGVYCYAKGDENQYSKLPCPLVPVPPHGRLIDADALKEIIKAHDYPLRAHFNSTDNGMFTIGIQQAVDETPTIIPAEEGER